MDTHFCRTPTFPSPFFFPETKAQQQKTEVSKATHKSGCQGGREVSSKPPECCRKVNGPGKRVRELGLFNLDRKRLRETLSRGINIWVGRQGKRREGKTLLSGAHWQDKKWPQTEIQENHLKQKKTPFILLGMIKHWNRLSREAEEPPVLELLKTQTRFGPEQTVPADGALSTGLDNRPSEAPSSLNYSIIPRCWTETWTQHQNQAASAITMLDLMKILIFL